MRRIVSRIVVSSLVAIGMWQIGAGLYIHAKAHLAQYLMADAWSRVLDGEQRARPWPWSDAWPVARLRVAKSDTDLYVLSDATGRSLAFGPGVLSGSATPGDAGNAVISAHRDTHFRFLRDAPLGTELSLQTPDGRWHRFKLVESYVLDVRHERLMIHDARPTLTLLTCYPFDAIVPGGPLRYAAIAERISEPQTGQRLW